MKIILIFLSLILMISCNKHKGCVEVKIDYLYNKLNDTITYNCENNAEDILTDIYGPDVWTSGVNEEVVTWDSISQKMIFLDSIHIKCSK